MGGTRLGQAEARHGVTGGRFGLIAVGIGLVSIGFSGVISQAAALLLVAVPADTGWSYTATATALASFAIGKSAGSAVIGMLCRRWAPIWVMTASAVVTALGLALLSIATSPEMLGIAIAVLIAPWTMGFGTLGSFILVQTHVAERRGMALAVADSGASWSSILLVPPVQYLILTIGWRSTCQLLGMLILALVPVYLLVSRMGVTGAVERTQADASAADAPGVRDLLRLQPLWVVAVGLAASAFAQQLLQLHQVAYLTIHGFDATSIATTFILIGGAGLIGRPGFGWLSDRLGARVTYGLLTASLLVCIGSLAVAGEYRLLPPLWLYAVTFGVVLGVSTLLFARQLGGLIDARSFGTAIGILFVCRDIGGALGPASAAWMFESTGTYSVSFVVATLMALASGGCMWALTRYWRAKPGSLGPA